jgi:hypothetical protein
LELSLRYTCAEHPNDTIRVCVCTSASAGTCDHGSIAREALRVDGLEAGARTGSYSGCGSPTPQTCTPGCGTRTALEGVHESGRCFGRVVGTFRFSVAHTSVRKEVAGSV